MALLKEIELDSGIVLNYHRIVSINKITNHSIILEIGSYTSKEKRKQEIEQQKAGKEITPYIATNYISVPYDEDSTIKDWYSYLKTTDKYAGAKDDEDPEEKS